MFHFGNKSRMPEPGDALPGREQPLSTAERHFVNDQPLKPPYPAGSEVAEFALGCFWGEEKLFWQQPGVIVTAVGYEGGFTSNPTYEEVCTGRTGHAETVRIVFDPSRVGYEQLLKLFWEAHDPTQGMRQGNDIGTQYRSAIFTHSDAQAAAAVASRDAFQTELTKAGYGEIVTEIRPATEFYFAEDYHQQYLAKVDKGVIDGNPYCPDHSTRVACPLPTGVLASSVDRVEAPNASRR